MYYTFEQIRIENALCQINGAYNTAQIPDPYHPVVINRGKEDTTVSQRILHLDDLSVFNAFEAMIMGLEKSGIKDTKIVLPNCEYRLENESLTYKENPSHAHVQHAELVITVKNAHVISLLEAALIQAKPNTPQAAFLQTPKL